MNINNLGEFYNINSEILLNYTADKHFTMDYFKPSKTKILIKFFIMKNINIYSLKKF